MKPLAMAVALLVIGSTSAAVVAGREDADRSDWRRLPLITDGKVDPDWSQIGGGEFIVDDGSLRTECHDTMGMLLYAKEKFGNCQIKVVFKCRDAESNSGVFIRIDDGVTNIGREDRPPPGTPRSIERLMHASEHDLFGWYPVHHGYEVQICEASEEYHRTGAIYSLAKAAELPAPPADGWRTMIIDLDESRVNVEVGGVRVTTFDSDDPNLPERQNWYEPKREPKRPHVGYIGLQTHDPGDEVWFREVNVRPLVEVAKGPLRVHPQNPRYFTDGSKAPDGSLNAVYLTGSHTWGNLCDYRTTWPAFDYSAYLDFLQRHNHNFIRLWAGDGMGHDPVPYARVGPDAANDGGLQVDVDQFDPAFFERLRSRVVAARDRGVYVGIMLFTPDMGAKREDWDHLLFHPNNNVQGINADTNGDGSGAEAYDLSIPRITAYQEAFARRVVDTVNDLDNVLYEIGNEGDVTSVQWQYHFIQLIKSYEAEKPKQHPVGMTAVFNILEGSWTADDRALLESPADWISPALEVYRVNPPAADGRKVIVADVDHIWPSAPRAGWVWKCFLRGIHPILMDQYTYGDPSWASVDEQEAMRNAMGDTLARARKLNLAAMTPQNSLASTEYCLANPGVEYLVYQPKPGEAITVELKAATYRYEWFDPATGVAAGGGRVESSGGEQSFQPPIDGDAVLHLTRKDPPRPEPQSSVLHQTIDLNVGESRRVELSDGSTAEVKLVDVAETRDSVRDAIREARATVEINGETATVVSGNYRLPVAVGGVQVDCTATSGLYRNRDPWEDSWGLDHHARLRFWPAGSPWMTPGEFVYPIKQRWFASATQMSNEPSHVDGGDAPNERPIYYHNGLDIGGCEGLAEVVAATDGTVVSAGRAVLPGYEDPPVASRYDVIYIRDSRDWYYRYSHLKTIEVQLGEQVKMGQRIGLLGKEGGSGGWSHLHFDIKSKQPSGKWGTEDGYAFLWEAYRREYAPPVVAVARPHHLIWAGESVTLDGSRSWSAGGKIDRHEWTLTDGTTANGPTLERAYEKPGEYSEILKVVGAQGNVDYDFAVVLVIDRATAGKYSPTIHSAYAPTLGIHPGDPVTFNVRTFFTEPLGETWDFGDGSPPVQVRSDANADSHAPDGYATTVHRYEKPGDYLVRVEQQTSAGTTITARLHVQVEESPVSSASDER